MICSICYNPSHLSLFVNYQRIFNKSKMTGATSGAGSYNPSWAFEFTLVFCGARVAKFLVFYVVFCRSLYFALLIWSLTVLSVNLQLTCTCKITALVSSNFSFVLYRLFMFLFLFYILVVIWKNSKDIRMNIPRLHFR